MQEYGQAVLTAIREVEGSRVSGEIIDQAEAFTPGRRDDITVDLSHVDINILALASQRFVEEMKQISLTEVRVMLPEYHRQDVHYLENFVIRTAEGQEAPLFLVPCLYLVLEDLKGCFSASGARKNQQRATSL